MNLGKREYNSPPNLYRNYTPNSLDCADNLSDKWCTFCWVWMFPQSLIFLYTMLTFPKKITIHKKAGKYNHLPREEEGINRIRGRHTSNVAIISKGF